MIKPGRDETPEQRADRNFGDLLQELRVTQTGVQILFSLLLTVPFSARFEQVTWLALLDSVGAGLLTRQQAPAHLTASAAVLSRFVKALTELRVTPRWPALRAPTRVPEVKGTS